MNNDFIPGVGFGMFIFTVGLLWYTLVGNILVSEQKAVHHYVNIYDEQPENIYHFDKYFIVENGDRRIIMDCFYGCEIVKTFNLTESAEVEQ